MDIKLRDHKLELKIFKLRSIFIVCCITLFSLLLLCRMFYLQIIKHQDFATLANNNHIALIPIEPVRGLIYDRNGILLASNKTSFNLNVNLQKLNNWPEVLTQLQNLIDISDEDLSFFNRKRKVSKRLYSIPLKLNLTKSEIAVIQLNQHKLPGTSIEAAQTREYWYPEAFAHSIGYVGKIAQNDKLSDKTNYLSATHIGKSGIEQYYEKKLRGQTGFEQVEINAKGKIIRVINHIPASAGSNLYLSIDAKLQNKTWQAMRAYKGSAVALNPNNGEVLAMVSSPSFNPNLFVTGIPRKIYQKLYNSKQQPLFNRSIQGQYAPASIIKPFIALAGLEERLIDAATTIYDQGWFKLEDSPHLYRDWKRDGHGWTNLHKAIIESCDTYFYKLAYQLNIDTIAKWLRLFGLGEKTGIDLPFEAKGLVPSKSWKEQQKHEAWYKGDTINTGIGQGFLLATPLQMAYATNLLANHGKMFTPHLLLKEQLPTKEIKNYSPELNKQIQIKEKNLQLIIQAMLDSVHHYKGTAYNIGRNLTYKVAGKTGTAQLFSLKGGNYDHFSTEEHLRDNYTFIAFAPVENPTISVAVVIENSKGSKTVAKTILDQYLRS